MELSHEQLDRVRESSADLKDKSNEELKAEIQQQLDELLQKVPEIVKTELATAEASMSAEERAEFAKTDRDTLVDQIMAAFGTGLDEAWPK